TDPTEQRNLAADPQHAAKLTALRADLNAWMKSQGDTQKVFAKPRLLSDPNSHGPKAEINDQQKQKQKGSK
ncbi:MAG: hypothetical protein ABMA26_01655, partial [Limisphaerales bacterium]